MHCMRMISARGACRLVGCVQIISIMQNADVRKAEELRTEGVKVFF